jgi:ribonuclease-3
MNFIQKIRFSSIWEKEDEFTGSIKKLIGHKPKDISFYKIAFTHKSESKVDHKGSIINYERLEFLGDSLLDASITTYLYHNLPESREGDLTQMRSKIVSREHLNEVGKDLDLVSMAKRPSSKRKFSYNAYGDLFEALVAAIYLDRGFEVMDKFIQKKLIEPYVDLQKLQGKITSYKSLFIEWCQKHHHHYHFDIFEDSGKDHEKHFGVKLSVNNEIISKGRSTSKKKAEEIACKRAYYVLQDQGITQQNSSQK